MLYTNNCDINPSAIPAEKKESLSSIIADCHRLMDELNATLGALSAPLGIEKLCEPPTGSDNFVDCCRNLRERLAYANSVLRKIGSAIFE